MQGPAPLAAATPPSVAAEPGTLRPGPSLRDAVRALRRGTALVVGDAMLDRYVFGAVERVSPEAPVPILTVTREVALPGGAGNVVRSLTALGAPVAFVSVVGDDQAGSDLTGLIGGQPGVEPWLLVQGGRATTTKTRFIASGQQLLRADHEITAPIHPRLADRLIRIAQDAVAATAVMVLSDYRKGVLAGDTPARLIAAARTAGRRVVVGVKDDAGGLERFAGADVVLLTPAGLAAAGGGPVGTEAEQAAAATALCAAHGFGAVLIGRGMLDAILVVAATGDTPAELRLLPAEAAELLDPAGAADTMLAVVAAGLGAGLGLPVAARLAAIAGGVALGKAGIAAVREEDLLEALTPGRLAARKLASRPQAAERVERWRRAGCRVGFIVGGAGATALAGSARAWCDRLVVGLAEADPGGSAIAELAAVDLIARFGPDGPLDLIRLLRPDVLVQDPARAPETVAGGELLLEWGGEIRQPAEA